MDVGSAAFLRIGYGISYGGAGNRWCGFWVPDTIYGLNIMFELSLFWGPSSIKLFMNPRGGLFRTCFACWQAEFDWSPNPSFILNLWKNWAGTATAIHRCPRFDVRPTTFRSIPQPHESLAILPGEPTELATLSCSTRRLVSLCCGGQRFCCLRPSFTGNPGGKMNCVNCVIGARWKKMAQSDLQSLSAQCWPSHHVFFPLSLSLYNWVLCPRFGRLEMICLLLLKVWRCTSHRHQPAED